MADLRGKRERSSLLSGLLCAVAAFCPAGCSQDGPPAASDAIPERRFVSDPAMNPAHDPALNPAPDRAVPPVQPAPSGPPAAPSPDIPRLDVTGDRIYIPGMGWLAIHEFRRIYEHQPDRLPVELDLEFVHRLLSEAAG